MIQLRQSHWYSPKQSLLGQSNVMTVGRGFLISSQVNFGLATVKRPVHGGRVDL
jgi:hypothetical protein